VFLLQGGVDGLMLNIHGPLSLNEMFDISNYGNPLVADKIDVSKVFTHSLTHSLLLNHSYIFDIGDRK
jgi:hypothetical protein